jgi:tetratricopeptide (TPR) repeat protein/tRNA A-37 threonylcarbamoyl transferase component Bud32
MAITCPKCKADNPEELKFCGECGTKLLSTAGIDVTETIEAPKEELTTGSTFAERYQIIEELGRGGMGKVYRVLDKELKEEVALKLIRPEIAKDEKTIERFKNELKFARKISHRNIGRMYELMEDKGTHFITMQYVSGQDLRGLIRQTGQLTTGKAISIAKEICEGLIEAHHQGVIHRDLKPSNIIIDKDGNARILDFGIARSVERKGITGAGVMIGTPEYMSPEQVEGKETDQRSDIYSLGVILYEMVTGRVPFEGDTPFTVGVKHKSEIPKDPKELNEQISGDLSNVILKCLEKDKDKRYQSAQEVRSELVNIADGIPTTERVIPDKKPLTSREITVTFGLKKLFVPVLVVVALIVAAVILWRFVLTKEMAPPVPTDKPSLAILYFENNSGDEALDNWRSGLSEMLTTDLSQSTFLHVLSSDRIYTLLEKQNLLDKDKYSTDDLKSVATQGGVNHLIRGSIITAGEKFIINASLIKADTADVISSIREEGIGEASITDSLDKITKQIKANLNLSEEQISGDLDRELAQITTKSPEAFKYYSEGLMVHNKGQYREAIPLFQRAIAVDPEFAMAYRGLGIAFSNLGLAPQGREYMEKAMGLKDRLSDKERFNIEGSYYGNSENTYEESIVAYKKVLKLYPDETTANHNLAIIFDNLEQWEQAIPYYEAARQAKTDFVGTYTQLATSYRAIGELDKAKEVLDDCLENTGDSASIHLGMAPHYLQLGKYDTALSEVEKAISLDPSDFWNIAGQARVYRYLGDLKKAENTYWQLLEFTEPGAGYVAANGGSSLSLIWGKFADAESMLNQGIARVQMFRVKWVESEWRDKLAYIHSQTSNHEEALKECEEALENATQAKSESFDLQRTAMHMKGLVQLANQSIAEAQITADGLKEFIEAGVHKKSIRLYYHLMGRIELEKGNYSKAIDFLREALALTSFHRDEFQAALSEGENEIFLESLALAFYRSGDLKKAQEQYENLIALTPGDMFYGDIYTRSFYMLGKIYEEKGDTIKATENYEKFLALWKEADPGMAELADARTRLSSLKN